jgi:copper chaperone CopZ
MPGVIKAEANFIAGTATVTFDDTKTSVEQIVKNFERQNLAVLGEPKMIK